MPVARCTQAFIMPMLYLGPAHLDFWTYIICHTAIVAAAVYDYAARDYRPNWHDWRIVVLFSAVYVLCVMAVNVRLSVNYGYMGKTDFAQAAFVLALGEWPARVPRLVAIVWAGMAGMVLLGNGQPTRQTSSTAPVILGRIAPAGRRAA